MSGFTATAVGELNNDDFEGGNNSGDWAFKNWFWVLKFWFCDGGWKLFKAGGSDDGVSGGGKKVDGGDEGGRDKRSLFPLVFFFFRSFSLFCIKKLIPSSGGAFFYKLFCDVLFANIKLS